MSTDPQPYFALTAEERLRQTEATYDQYRRVFYPVQPEFNTFQRPWLVQDFIPLGGLVILVASSLVPRSHPWESGEG